MAGRVNIGWEVLNPTLAKAAVPVIQPDLKALVSERLLDNNVRRSISVHVQRRDGQRDLSRFEDQIRISAGSEMELDNPEAALGSPPVRVEKDCTVWLAITVEIGRG